jgi:diguanylate cyclase (GGDEF)-like protein
LTLRLPVLLSLPDSLLEEGWAPEQDWRLVSSLYAQPRSLVQGGLALVAVLAVCWWHTGGAAFIGMAVCAILILALRLRHRAWFWRMRNAAGGPAGEPGPRGWGLEFTLGAWSAAALWGATDLCVVWQSTDPDLQLFVLTVQATWLAGATVRNAASPASVVGGAVLTLVPSLLAVLLTHQAFVAALASFVVLQFAATLAMALYLSQQIVALMESEQRLAAAESRLGMVSATDGLTGIANRRAFDTALHIEWGRAAREASDVAVLMIDVDHFKLYNDTYGHLLGDDCLRVVAGLVFGALRRPSDVAARFGGEAFAVLLPATSEAGARDVADRFRVALASASLPHAGSPFSQVTVSVGVASMAPAPGNDPQSLISLADRALYDAKQAGRNRVRGAADRLQLGAWRAQRAADADPPPAATGDTMPPEPARPPDIPAGLTVLVLEDDANVAVVLEDMLAELRCEVIGPCRSADAALALIKTAGPRVALLDINLGDSQDGYIVAAALAERGIPFAFVTGGSPGVLRADFATRPLLSKPFHFSTLIRLIAALAKES